MEETNEGICECGKKATHQLNNGTELCDECYEIVRKGIEDIKNTLNK